MIRSSDEVFGEFTLREETENEQCGMGDSIEFRWFSVYVGDPHPYAGPLAKFKIKQHAEAFMEAANRAITSGSLS